MLVALSILFAALVGGVVFMLLDGWQRRRVAPAASAGPAEATAPYWPPREPDPPAAWSPPAEPERPLPAWDPEPRRESPPLWTPPPERTAAHWDDDDRPRRDDDEDSPPGLWSGWARR